MITNLMNITWRYLMRQKANTAMHIIGLTLGITVCLLIVLFVRYEMSFDGYHPSTKNTYRVISDWLEQGQLSQHFSTPFPLASALRNDASGFEHVTFVHPVYAKTVEVTPQKRFIINHIIAVEPEFAEIFSVEVIQGDLHQTLRQPYQAVLTESTAKKMFGSENPIGKTFKFKIREDFEFTVTTLIKDLPANTHLEVSILVSHSYKENFLKPNLDGWTYVSGTETFITLPKKADTSVLMAQLKNIADKYINAKIGPMYRSDFELQAMSDIHFGTNLSDGHAMSVSWLWFFAGIGLTVLVLACINFVNLSTAQALTRAKEVGIRKSIGAGRGSLITQFLTEAWILTFISGIVAIALTQLLLPFVNTMLGKDIAFDLFESPAMLITLILGLTLTGLSAGIYPAWVIAKFNPSVTLKVGVLTAGGGSSWLRKGLVVAQFTVSACLLMAVILMAQQVDYLRSKNLGFDKDHVVVVEVNNTKKTAAVLSHELSAIPSVAGVSFSTSTPSSEGHWGTLMSRISRNDPGRKSMTLILADNNFGDLYKLKLLAGRTLQPADTSSIGRALPEEQRVMRAVVNEQLIRGLGFESNEAAIGQRIHIGFNEGKVDIVGVVANFNQGPLSKATTPVLITSQPREYEIAGIKIEKGSDIPKALAAIETAWKKAFPEGVFTYKFLDEQIDAYYKAEERLFNLFKIFSGIAMLISCLGLFALAAFTTQHRVKEIGIRKVLGATVSSILMLVSKDFVKLVFAALVLATPIAWYGVHQWLSNYAYHIEITGWAFGIAGVMAMVVTLTAIGTQAFKSALANPAESLKSE
ncbi:ABC transporter permease [Cytophagales bacterium WSM2-2]|nr:ABC transporter permease [Cytophagales bacterium WSM2-2]